MRLEKILTLWRGIGKYNNKNIIKSVDSSATIMCQALYIYYF